MVLEQRIKALQHQLSDASLAALPEFHQRAAVLRQLGYLDADNTVQLKGRVACEINSVQVGASGCRGQGAGNACVLLARSCMIA
jgi:superfamily II RNA helicase